MPSLLQKKVIERVKDLGALKESEVKVHSLLKDLRKLLVMKPDITVLIDKNE